MNDATNATEMREFAQMLDQVFTARRGDDHRVGGPLSLDRELWSTLAELGLARLTGPESDGGSGAGWAEASYLLGAAGAGAAAVPVAENDLLAGWLLALSGADRAVADPAAVRTAAVLDASGADRHVPWARDVDAVTVLYPADGGWRVADVARADVEVTEGVDLASEPRDDIRVDLSAVSGATVPEGTDVEFLRRGALARTLAIAGSMARILDLVVEHTTARVQFGRPLAKFQSVQNLVADLAAESALTRAAADAAVRIAEGSGFGSDEAGFAIAAAKSCAGHAAAVVVRNAHQALGAIGFTMEHELHRHANRILSWRSEFGSVRYWDEVLTRAAVAAGGRGLWPLIVDGKTPVDGTTL